MAILHDIVKIDAGNNIVYANDPHKFKRELKAAERIFGILPNNMMEDYLDLWVEFEKKECPESKFVGALDRFIPLMSNYLNKGHSWKKHNINFQMILNKNEEAISKGSKKLWTNALSMLEESLKKGLLSR